MGFFFFFLVNSPVAVAMGFLAIAKLLLSGVFVMLCGLAL